MRLFSYDGVLAQAARAIWRLLVLNFCFAVCCLPVVTVGASITALYSVFLNQSTESGSFFRFFRAFRENFRQTTCHWLVCLAFFAVLGADVYLLLTYRFPGAAAVKILTAILAGMALSVQAFLFPLAAHYENSTRRTWRNALVLGLSMLPYGVVMSAISLLPLIVFWIDLDLTVLVLAVWLPLGGALAAQVNSWMLKRIFAKLQPQDG